jgi:very-short-patch-repair endonuclease
VTGDLFRQYARLARSEPKSMIDRYERDEWEDRYSSREPEINVRVLSLGDALQDSAFGVMQKEELPLRYLSGGAWASFDHALRLFVREDHETVRRAGVMEVMNGLPLCESPIEKHILPWLVLSDCGLGGRRKLTPVVTDIDCPEPKFIVCQAPFLGYRLDFLIVERTSDGCLRVALECDGADFHGKVRDDKRDQDLLSGGVVTVRASGREIYDQPWRVVARVDEALANLREAS